MHSIFNLTLFSYIADHAGCFYMDFRLLHLTGRGRGTHVCGRWFGIGMVRCGWASFPVGILVRMVPASLGGIEGKDCDPYGAAWPSGTSGAQGGWCSPYGAAWPKGPAAPRVAGWGRTSILFFKICVRPGGSGSHQIGDPDPSSL